MDLIDFIQCTTHNNTKWCFLDLDTLLIPANKANLCKRIEFESFF